MDFNSGSEMLPVNAAKISAAGEHHQNRLRLGIGGVVFEMEKHAQLNRVKVLRPVALFARYAGGDEAIAFHGRLDRVVDGVENNVHQLTGAGFLTLHPPNGAGATWQPTHSTLVCGEFWWAVNSGFIT